MRLLVLILILLLYSCTPKQDRIMIPSVSGDFYSQALLRINDDLDEDESNLKLIEQKIYYCDLLGWPSTCITALDELKRQKGMTPQLLDQYITYYDGQKEYAKLLAVIERWGEEFEVEDEYQKQKILGLLRSSGREETFQQLQHYMVNRSSAQDLAFAADCYLELGDIVMSSYFLGKLSAVDPTNSRILDVYPDLLFRLGYEEQAFLLLERKAKIIPENFEFHSDLAFKYEAGGMFAKSRDNLKRFVEKDSVVYRIADLFLEENLWDSAHQYVDLLIARDSLDRQAWLKKAIMYEERGWLTQSLNYYDHVIYLNPGDSIAIQRTALVRQKIAYLQRLKFEENQLPPPVLKSKKLINNE